MNWLTVKSLEELKTLGKLKDVRDEVQKSIGGVVNLKVNSWKNLYLSIAMFQEVLKRLDLEPKEHKGNQ